MSVRSKLRVANHIDQKVPEDKLCQSYIFFQVDVPIETNT
jgi:hypothetical protein